MHEQEFNKIVTEIVLDTLKEELFSVACVLRSYYDDLIGLGFNDEQAMDLVVNLQAVLLASMMIPKVPETEEW